MHAQNSYVRFAKGAMTAVFTDIRFRFPQLAKELMRDEKRICSALEQHGLDFVCRTLPAFSKHFDRCLDEARLTPSRLIHFGSMKRGVPVPRLLRGLILRVFELGGSMREDADSEAVRAIRQVCNLLKKLRVPSDRVSAARAAFDMIQHDSHLRESTLNWATHEFEAEQADKLSLTDLVPPAAPLLGEENPYKEEPQLLDTIQRVADWITSTLGVYDPLLYKPRHGPGVVSDSNYGSNKYENLHWTDKLETVFPEADFAHANYRSWIDSLGARSNAPYGERPCKLLAVPKEYRKPRLIASEPTSHQWCQQSIRRFFYERCSATLLSRVVRFDDQTRNGRLARAASHTRSHATIDLSNASDSVSCFLVERFFRRSPSLLQSLWASRSGWMVQDLCRVSPRLIRLKKYSTMGNATTFPVQSLVFAAIAIGSCLYEKRRYVTTASIREILGGKVHVFGDDIIVPRYAYERTVMALSLLGFKVNTSKTFGGYAFRESCGVDAFKGHVVTPVRILDKVDRSRPGTVVSNVDTQKNLLQAGWFSLSDFIRKAAGRFGRLIQTVPIGSEVFGWYALDVVNDLPYRYNRTLHRREVRTLCVEAKRYTSPSDNNAGLLQFFTEEHSVCTSPVSTLCYNRRYPVTKLVMRWAAAG